MTNKFQVLRVNNPFDRNDREIFQKEFTIGDTVEDLVTGVFPDGVDFTVSINGSVVPIEDYSTRVIRHSDCLMLIPTIHGSGGGKSVLRVVAMIAISFASYGAGAAIAGATSASGSLAFGASTLASAGLAIAGATAVGILGGMLLNALTPMPSQTTGSNASTSQSYGWNPVNTQQQGLAVAYWYGTMRVKSANIIASYIKHDGAGNQTLNALLHYGMGPIHDISDYKLNDQPLGEQLTPIVKLGTIDQTLVEGFSDTPVEYSHSALVEHATPITYTTIGDNFDAIEIDLNFPGGLYYVEDDGSKSSRTVEVRVEMRKLGSSTWTNVSSSIVSILTWVVTTGYWSAGYWTEGWVQEGDGGDYQTVWSEVAIGSTVKTDHTDGEAYFSSPTTSIEANTIWRWMPVNGATQAFVDTTSLLYVINTPTDGDPYLVNTGLNHRVATKPLGSAFTNSYTYKIPSGYKGQYEIRVTRDTVDSTDVRISDQVYFGNVREVVYDDFTYPRQALVGINALATEQLNGGFSFSALVEGRKIWTYNGTSWTFEFSNNPAWICWDVLTQPITSDAGVISRYDGIDSSYLDLTSFYSWAQFCDDLVTLPDGVTTEKRFVFDGGFDSVSNLWEAALKVAQMSRAFLVWQGYNITVTIDKADSVTQVFTVGNQGLDSFNETFMPESDLVSAIEVDYLDEDSDYEKTKIRLYDPSLPNSNNIMTINYLGITKQSQALRTARYLLNQNKYIKRTVEFDADIDAIGCTVGDVIAVQHDVPEWGEGGRLVSATSTSVTLDKEVTLEPGTTYTVLVRDSSDNIVEKTVQAVVGTTVTATLNLTTAFTTTPNQYDVYSFGVLNNHYKKFRILTIAVTSEQKATITAVEYNENIYSDETYGENTTVETVTNTLVSDVSNVAVNEQIYYDKNKNSKWELIVTWDKPRDSKYKEAIIAIKIGTNTYIRTVGTSPGSSFTIEDVLPNTLYTIYVASVNKLGQPNSIYTAPYTSITTSTSFLNEYNPNLVAGPTSLNTSLGDGTFSGKDCTLLWSTFGTDWSNKSWFSHYEIVVTSLADVTRSTHTSGNASFTYTFNQNQLDGLSADFKVKVRTVDVWDNASPYSTVTVSHNNPADITGLQTALGDGTFSGRDCILGWNASSDTDGSISYDVVITETDTTARSSYVVTDNFFNYTFERNSLDTLASDFIVKVRVTDAFGYVSNFVSLTVSHNTPVGVSSITTTSKLFGIDVILDYARESDFQAIKLYVNDTDTIGTATLLASITGNVYEHNGLAALTNKYYWATVINLFGQESAKYPVVNGILGQTDSSPSELLSILTGSLTTDQLATSLLDTTEKADVMASEYKIKTNVDGHIAGIGLGANTDGTAAGVSSEVVVVADIFKVVNPSLSTDIAQVFTVGTIDGSAAVGIQGSLIVDGSASVRSLAAGTISADNIYLGSSNFALHSTNSQLIINDGTRDRVLIGGDGLGDYGLAAWDSSGNEIINAGGLVWGGIQDVPALVKNLIDPSQWVIGSTGNQGSSALGVFFASGTAAENSIALTEGPFGYTIPVWECIPDSASDADGGWTTSAINIDTSKSYISVVYFKKLVSGGNFYHGCYQAYGLDDVLNSNPYFNISALYGKWYLSIGVIHGSGYTGGPSGISGIYDVNTGEKIASGSDFKINAASSIQTHRAYLYYDTSGDSSTVHQLLANPYFMEATEFKGIGALIKADSTTGALNAGVSVSSGTTTFSGTGAIQSSGFVSGSSGWQIKGDGISEFEATGIRGQLEANSIIGTGTYLTTALGLSDTTVYVNDTSAFPASGNIWLSTYGSTYKSGITLAYTSKTATTFVLSGAAGYTATIGTSVLATSGFNWCYDANNYKLHYLYSGYRFLRIGPTGGAFSVGAAPVAIDTTGLSRSGLEVTADGAVGISSLGGTYGVYGTAPTYGIYGRCSYNATAHSQGYGGYFEANLDSGKGMISLKPAVASSAPTHTAASGTFWVASDGSLYYNKTGSTTWINLA